MNKIFIALLKYWKEKTNNQKKKKKTLKGHHSVFPLNASKC